MRHHYLLLLAIHQLSVLVKDCRSRGRLLGHRGGLGDVLLGELAWLACDRLTHPLGQVWVLIHLRLDQVDLSLDLLLPLLQTQVPSVTLDRKVQICIAEDVHGLCLHLGSPRASYLHSMMV